MPHMKKPFSFESLRPGRKLEPEVSQYKPTSAEEVQAGFKQRKRSKQHRQYVEGKLQSKPTKTELELLLKKGK